MTKLGGPARLGGVVVLAVAAALTGCGRPTPTPLAPSTSTASEPAPQLPDTSGQVRYEVESTDGTSDAAEITVKTPTGTRQESVDLPLRNKNGGFGLIFTFGSGDFLYISAQNQDYGSITCRITDVTTNRVIAENTSKGRYTIATCDGQAL